MEIIIENQDPVLMTIEGGKNISEVSDHLLILPHEHFIQNLNQFYQGDTKSIEKIELSNISYIRNNPFHNMNNLCLNDDEEIWTEIKQAFGENKILLVESTEPELGRDMNRTVEIGKNSKNTVIIGYKPVIKGKLYEEEEKNFVFLNVEKLTQELEEQYFNEKTLIKPGVLGEFRLDENLFDKYRTVIFESCVKLSAKHGIPLYLECHRSKDFQLLNNTLDLVNKYSGSKSLKLVLWNLHLETKREIKRDLSGNYSIQTSYGNNVAIENVIKQKIYLGFDAFEYSQDLFELAGLIKILVEQGHQEYILLSSGVKFKSNLLKYGGAGYGYIENLIQTLKEVGVDDSAIECILKKNPLNLLNWWKPLKPKEKYIIYWKCHHCGKASPESVGKFAKDGHEFCSAKYFVSQSSHQKVCNPQINLFKIQLYRSLSKFMQERGWELYKSIKEPKFICAPMVDQSELAFRMLTRKYGATLCYTPMLHSRVAIEDKSYLPVNFTTCPEDRPLFVQFCGNDPDTLLEAAKLVQDRCDAVDINFGCPQGIARKGHYGSFLLEDQDLVVRLVEKLAQNLKVPVTCKIRILPNEKDTMKLVHAIEKAGCAILTVHGRTKEQNKQRVGKADWNMIKKIKEALKIPVFANGGIYTYEDAINCLKYTGVDAVMSSESLLENPGLFSGTLQDMDEMAAEYIEMAKLHHPDISAVRGHLFKILYAGLQIHTDLREEMTKTHDLEGFSRIAQELKERRKDVEKEKKLGWYMRYMPEDCFTCYNDHLLQDMKPEQLEKTASSNSKKSEEQNIKTEDLFDGDSMSNMFG